MRMLIEVLRRRKGRKAQEVEVEISVPIEKIRKAPKGALGAFQRRFPWAAVSRNSEEVAKVTHVTFDLSRAPSAAVMEAALKEIPG